MNTPDFEVGDIIRTHSGRTAWRIDSIGPGSRYSDRRTTVYRCTSLTSSRHQEYRLTDPWIERWTGALPDRPAVPILLKGHALQHEGGPFTAGRTYANASGWDRSGDGRGLCSCGALSDVLPTRAARKRWHKDHKAAARAEQTA